MVQRWKERKGGDAALIRRIWELSKDSPYMAKMNDADLRLEGENASCGDWLEISLRMRGRKITAAQFLHKGCALSAVGASVLCEYLEGKTLAAARNITPKKQLALFGAPVSPARLACVLLPLETVRRGKEK